MCTSDTPRTVFDVPELRLLTANFDGVITHAGKPVAVIRPSLNFPGQLTWELSTGREIARKAGKSYADIAAQIGAPKTDAEVCAWAELYLARHGDGTFFISEAGDVDRIKYAYSHWPSIAHSCMAGGEVAISEDLRGDATPSVLLDDHIHNIDEIQTAMLHRAGDVIARCLVRKVYSDGEYIGRMIDRRYATSDAIGDTLAAKIKAALPDVIGVRRNGGAGEAGTDWTIEGADDVADIDPYIILEPNEDGGKQAYQDTFKYFDHAANRAYYRSTGGRETISYNSYWSDGGGDCICEHCGRRFHSDDDDADEINGLLFCSRDCVYSYGFEYCQSCGDWYNRDNEGVCTGDGGYCSESCANRAGYYECAHCREWEYTGGRGNSDHITTQDDTFFCCADHALEGGYNVCESCGEWVEVGDGTVEIDGVFFCDSGCAINGGYAQCYTCGEWYDDGDGEEDERGLFHCEDCAERARETAAKETAAKVAAMLIFAYFDEFNNGCGLYRTPYLYQYGEAA